MKMWNWPGCQDRGAWLGTLATRHLEAARIHGNKQRQLWNVKVANLSSEYLRVLHRSRKLQTCSGDIETPQGTDE